MLNSIMFNLTPLKKKYINTTQEYTLSNTYGIHCISILYLIHNFTNIVLVLKKPKKILVQGYMYRNLSSRVHVWISFFIQTFDFFSPHKYMYHMTDKAGAIKSILKSNKNKIKLLVFTNINRISVHLVMWFIQ